MLLPGRLGSYEIGKSRRGLSFPPLLGNLISHYPTNLAVRLGGYGRQGVRLMMRCEAHLPAM